MTATARLLACAMCLVMAACAQTTRDGASASASPASIPVASVSDPVVRTAPNPLLLRVSSSGAPLPPKPPPRPERSFSDADLECLAQTIYYEARGEPLAGQKGVAAVVLNRVRSADFPDSVCDVVREGQEIGTCQFSWYCAVGNRAPRDANAWSQSQELAEGLLAGQLPDVTDGALYFHSLRILPTWANRLEQVAEIGEHVYYR